MYNLDLIPIQYNIIHHTKTNREFRNYYYKSISTFNFPHNVNNQNISLLLSCNL